MSDKKRIIIVGGVAGGASAAARLRRLDENAAIIIFERGPYISFANCGLPYHIAGVIDSRDELLLQTPERMQRRFNIDVRVNHEVMAIDRAKKEVIVRDLLNNKEYKEQYDKLILSPGALPLRPPIDGIEHEKIFTLRNIPDMDNIIAALKKEAQHAVIVGGGYIGLEMAEALRECGLKVTIVELAEQVMAPVDPEMAGFLHQELIKNGVELRLGVAVTGFSDNLTVHLSDDSIINCDLAILAIGVRPDNKLAKEAGLDLTKSGGIAVDNKMVTSDPDIYAVGDALGMIPLAGPANRQGRIAADNICGRDKSYHQTQGTGICKVFNLAAAMTGLNEKALQQKKVPYQKIYLHGNNHAGYYPHATPIHLKLLFDPKDGKILGSQAVGRAGVARRIDILAMSIRAGQTVFALEEAELCYAPPYGSAKDVINYAGFVAANIIKGDMDICHVADVIDLKEGQILLDVRTPQEFNQGTIPNAINIPVDELRERIGELTKGHQVLVFCKVGIRGYIACRILKQHGYKCANLSGGYETFRHTPIR